MLPQKFYHLSSQLGAIARQFRAADKQLFEYQITRYKFFVDGSAAGFDCHYAMATKKESEHDKEIPKAIELLKQVRTAIDKLISELEK